MQVVKMIIQYLMRVLLIYLVLSTLLLRLEPFIHFALHHGDGGVDFIDNG